MKFRTLLLGAAAGGLLGACASGAPAPPETPRAPAREDARLAPLPPPARDNPARETARAEQNPSVAPRAAPPAGGALNLAGIIGREVKNARGETIGEIEEVLLDASGRVDMVIVGVGGFMGFGGRDVALRWSDLRFAEGGRDAFVTMTEMQLKQMPEYRRAPSGTMTTRGAAATRN